MSRIDWDNPVSDHPLNQGLVSWWLSGEENPYWGGPRWLDLCGRNHGTLANGPTWQGAKGRPGGWGSMRIPGGSGSAIGALCGAPSNAVFSSGQTISVEFFALTEDALSADEQTVLAYGNSGSSNVRNFQIRKTTGSGSLDFVYYDGASFHVYRVASFFTTGEWVHGRVRYTYGSGASIHVAKNGNSISGSWVTGSGNSAPASGVNSLAIGCLPGLTNETWLGLLDDVRISKNSVSGSAYYEALQGYPSTLNRVPRRLFFSAADAGEVSAAGGLSLLGVGI